MVFTDSAHLGDHRAGVVGTRLLGKAGCHAVLFAGVGGLAVLLPGDVDLPIFSVARVASIFCPSGDAFRGALSLSPAA